MNFDQPFPAPNPYEQEIPTPPTREVAELEEQKKERKQKVGSILQDIGNLSFYANLGYGASVVSNEEAERTQRSLSEKQAFFEEAVSEMEANKDLIVERLLDNDDGRSHAIQQLSGLLRLTTLRDARVVYRAKDIAAEILSEVMGPLRERIEDKVQHGPHDLWLEIDIRAVEALAGYAEGKKELNSEDEVWSERYDGAIAFFRDNKDLFLRQVRESIDEGGRLERGAEDYPLLLLECLLKHGKQETADEAAGVLIETFHAEEEEGRATELFEKLLKSHTRVLAEEDGEVYLRGSYVAVDLLKAIQGQYEVTLSTMADWAKSIYNKPEKLGDILRDNLVALRSLEKERPGAAKVLREKFGIRNFARYPKELLVKQFDQAEEDIPYGVAVFPVYDHNNAFSQEKGTLASLDEQLGGDYTVRIFEAEGTLDAVKRLLRADKKYGGKHKISFGVVGGHGGWVSEEGKVIEDEEEKQRDDFGVQLGAAHRLARLRPQDLEGNVAKRAKELFVDGAPFILSSCSAGHPKAIAETWSRVLDADVAAPSDVSYGVNKLVVTKTERGLRLDPTFGKVGKRVYKGGQLSARTFKGA